jgi:hypothetical protein
VEKKDDCFDLLNCGDHIFSSTSASEVGYITGRWLVERNCEGFYHLRDQLREFYGGANFGADLPSNDSPLYTKNARIFMEINRIAFERFLKTLLQQVSNTISYWTCFLHQKKDLMRNYL